jgi:hypothetical protein
MGNETFTGIHGENKRRKTSSTAAACLYLFLNLYQRERRLEEVSICDVMRERDDRNT